MEQISRGQTDVRSPSVQTENVVHSSLIGIRPQKEKLIQNLTWSDSVLHILNSKQINFPGRLDLDHCRVFSTLFALVQMLLSVKNIKPL